MKKEQRWITNILVTPQDPTAHSVMPHAASVAALKLQYTTLEWISSHPYYSQWQELFGQCDLPHLPKKGFVPPSGTPYQNNQRQTCFSLVSTVTWLHWSMSAYHYEHYNRYLLQVCLLRCKDNTWHHVQWGKKGWQGNLELVFTLHEKVNLSFKTFLLENTFFFIDLFHDYIAFVIDRKIVLATQTAERKPWKSSPL